MTETAGITVSNFIAGAIAVGLALLIIPTIVKGSIGSASGAVNKKDIEGLYSKIQGICKADKGVTANGEISLSGEYKIKIDGDKYTATKNGEPIDKEWENKDLDCTYTDGETELSGTRPYKIKKLKDDEFDFVG